MSDLGKQLRKGVLEVLVLKQLAACPQYGYLLLQELRNKSNGYFDLKEGTLYPILYRLEDEKWVETYWVEAEGRGLPKKYYRITDAGRQQAVTAENLWHEFVKAVNITLDVNGEIE